MSLTYGFYNSINEDRKYNASQMSKLFDGVLNDGIFMSIGDKFMVTANSGMNISVGTGRAWFNHTWTLNDSILVLPVSESEILLNRIDVVVLEVNNTAAVRANSIKIIKGAGATVPVAPDLVNNSEIHQYPLAHIYVGVGVTEILQANITNYVGTAETPFATGVMQTMNIDALIAQWQSEWDVWSAEQQADYIAWFNNINALLGTEPATNLQIQVSAHDVRLADLEYDARIAYIAEKIRNRNLIKNGDFKDGLTGFIGSGGIVSNDFVEPSIKYVSLDANPYYKTVVGNFSPSDVLYYSLRVYLDGYTSGVIPALDVRDSSGALAFGYVDTSILDNWQKVSTIFNATGNTSVFFGSANSICSATFYITGLTMANLTQIFGAGNEPTKEEVDAAIELLGGWTDVPIKNKYLTSYNLGTNINELTAKTTPVDADMLPLSDSAASNASKKATWANIKATLKTYFDGLYNNYIHPANHPASIITQDASNRFVTDSEKTAWNGKSDGAHTHSYLPLSGGQLTGQLSTVVGDFMISRIANTRSWIFHHSINSGLYIAPSTAIDGAGGDYDKGINIDTYGNTNISGATTVKGRLTVNNNNPVIGMQDTDGRSLFFYLNNGVFHILRGAGNNSETWEAYNEQWPFTLDVNNNDITVGGNFLAVAGNIAASGNVSAYSDERLKDNIVTIPNALAKVMALRGVEFDKDGAHNIGVIAQEVQKVVPEVVFENTDEMKTLSVAYGNLVGLLIEAIKDQQAQIDELRAKVN